MREKGTRKGCSYGNGGMSQYFAITNLNSCVMFRCWYTVMAWVWLDQIFYAGFGFNDFPRKMDLQGWQYP